MYYDFGEDSMHAINMQSYAHKNIDFGQKKH